MSIILDNVNYCYSEDTAYAIWALKDIWRFRMDSFLELLDIPDPEKVRWFST